MHLVLGHSSDACCAGVLATLRMRSLPARLVSNLLATPARLAWRLEEAGLDIQFAPDGHRVETIDSVLVRDVGWLDPAGWEPVDHAYMQAEIQAALLAWLASLSCPVVNRASAALWYRPRMPVLAWRPLLQRADLTIPETLFTNDFSQARNFSRSLKADGLGGVVCTPLTGEAAWLVDDADWAGIGALQELAPVCLTEPHGPARFACVVADRVLWDVAPPPEIAALAPRLARFANAAGLDLVEIAIAPVRRGPAVVLVEPRVCLEHFQPPVRERVLEALADVLSGEPTGVLDAEDALS